MAISFKDSKEQLTKQAPTMMSMRTMSLSNDTPVAAAEETFIYDTSGGYYKYYPNHYTDDKMSYVDDSKNIIVNDKQHNVTQENNSQCIPFEIDRYYDGVDLSRMKFSIHYVNSKNKEGVAIPINFGCSENKIRFGWLLDNGVTYVDGDVSFEIVAGGVNEKNESYIWRTRPNGKINILKSLTGDSTVRPTQSWYTQFITEMNGKLGELKAYATEAANAAEDAKKAAEEIRGDIQNQVASQLNPAIEAKFDEVLPSYYTKEEVYNKSEVYTQTEANSTIDEKIDVALESHYTKTEVNTLFEEFDISDQLETTNQAIADVDAKFADYDLSTEVDEKINDALENHYTKSEVDTLFEEFDISDQLEGINNEIGTINTKFENYDTSTEVDEKINTALGSHYTKGEIDTKFEEFDISEQLEGVNAEVDTVKAKADANAGEITALKTSVAANETSINGLTSNNTIIGNKISDLEAAVTELANNPGARYYAEYGTATLVATGEEAENVFTLYEVTEDGTDGEVKSQFVITGGGGGAATSTSLKVERVTASPLILTPKDKAIIEFNCTSTDADGETVDCSYTLKKGTTVIESGALVQGLNTFDLTEFVTTGTHKFTFTVTDEGGSMVPKTWTVQMVDVRLESEFSDQVTYVANEPVSFTYKPYGAISKTVHFKLDGKELDSVTTTASGLLQSYSLPAQAHGAHLLECYITATVNNVPIETDHIYKDIIWYDENSEIPVIGCIYRYDHYGPVAARQYNVTDIAYTVYDPNAMNPTVTRYVGGESIGTQKLEEHTNMWSYKTADIGEKVLAIECGVTTVEIKLDVAELGITIEPVTANLAFDFNPTGRSNNDADRIWSDDKTGVAMSVSDNFDWVNGGYQYDENGDQYFCVKAGTTATIGYNLFGADYDPKALGKEFKFIFKTTNVKKRSGTFLSCIEQSVSEDGTSTSVGIDMKVENAKIYAQNKEIFVPYCEDDIIEFEFNINKDTEIPLLMTYEDGVANRPLIYASDSSFMQIAPKPIVIGSADCDVHVYRMKAYNTSLTDKEILSNFIADARNADEMIARYNRNQIYDENGALTPEVLAEKCPDLRIIMIDAPWFTNDKDDKVKKTTVRQIYKGGDAVLDNWTCVNAQHSGQGTSSNKYGYAGRNIRLIMNKDDSLFTFSDGTTGKTVTLTRNSVPSAFYNIKVNIASSENQNNAQFARRYNEFNPVVRPAKVADPRVKDCMEFYNCVVFIRENEEDLTKHREFNDTNWHYYALGNIGDDKKTDNTRVNNAADPKECIVEITDFDVPMAEFPTGTDARFIAPEEWAPGNVAYDKLHSEYTYDEEGKFKAFGSESYEFRYEMDDITDEQREANINAWYDFYEFIVTSNDEEFVAHIEDHCVLDSLLYYYLFTERYLMVDNRAKNCFIHRGKVYISDAEATAMGEKAKNYVIDNAKSAINEGYRWDLCFAYDMDTSLGIDNTGKLVLTYGLEDIDKDASGAYVYRAAESNFFCRIRDLFADRLKGMFQSRESLGAWSSTDLINKWDAAQNQFPEELWRIDVERKYIRTYRGISVDNSIAGAQNPMFLEPMLNGRKRYQRRQFDRNQELYMATKYVSTFAKDDFIRLRFNNPTDAVIKQDYTLYLTPYTDMYIGVDFGNTGTISFRAKAGIEYPVARQTASDTADIVLIYGASFIQAIGDLSKCYLGDNDFSMASRLQSLTIGSNIEGYQNTFMTGLALGNNKLLEYLDIRNITGLNSVIDLSKCNNLIELRAEGSGATGVIFANGGKIEKAYIPDVTSLTMKNLHYLEELDVAGHNNLQTLVVENSPSVDTYAIVNAAPKLNTIRLIGIDWDETYNIADTVVLDRLYLMRGIDSAGYTVSEPIVTGKFHAAVVKDKKKADYAALWPELTITENTLVPQFIITFQNYDGTVLDVQYVDSETAPIDPLTRVENPISTPTKESSVSTNYTFAGWNRELTPALSNYVVTATYTETVRKYTVAYKSKGSLLQETKADYGSTVLYEGETPTYIVEEGAGSRKYYLFNGWDQSGYVDGDKIINAVFDDCKYELGYFDGKDLSELRPVEIYMMLQLNKAGVITLTDYVESGDTITISLGNDLNYSDINEKIFIPDETIFDGNNYKDTNELIISEDRDFVLAIDCKINSGNANNVVLAQCFDESNSTGFKVVYNSSKNEVNLLCGTETKRICSAGEREMIVIRHVKGENGLHLYSSHTSSTIGSLYEQLNGNHPMVSTDTDVSLVFGCGKRVNGTYINYCDGVVYWSKLWYADLGDDVCKKLAYWPHETITFEACFETDGRPKDYLLSSNEDYSSITFIASTVLTQPMSLGSATTGGWATAALNNYLNNRLYKAFPDIWRQLIKQVIVKSTIGDKSTEISNSNCYIFIPSVAELGLNTNIDAYAAEGSAIRIFSGANERICHNKNGDPVSYWTRSPNIGYPNYQCTITASGSLSQYNYAYESSHYIRTMFSI